MTQMSEWRELFMAFYSLYSPIRAIRDNMAQV
jgi:hypothetical protein